MSPSDQCPSPDQIIRLLDDAASSEERGEIESHLRICDACRQEYEEQREFRLLVEQLSISGSEHKLAAPHPPQRVTVPNHAIIQWIGRGASSDVWLARHTRIEQDRAIKIVDLRGRDPEDIARVTSEAKVMASLPKHRNRVILYDAFPEGTSLVLITEYVAGGPLSRKTSPESPMPWNKACKYVGDIAEALLEVHDRGVLHRDIKPANILWDGEHDEALLADFGLASPVTDSGYLVGTPGYIAPELLDGAATAKSDVFSLAATLFFLVTGKPPFDTTDVLTGLRQAAAGLASPVLALRNVPKAVEQVILAGLEPNAEQRIDVQHLIELLRGAHLQSLADQLRRLSQRSAVRLDVSVWTKAEDEPDFHPAVCQSQAIEPHRGMELVPEPSPAVSVRTGDLVCFEIVADTPGYLTFLNLSSSGNLVVVFPNPMSLDNRASAHTPHRVTVRMTPPAGTDRAALVWTRQPGQLTPEQWRKKIEAGESVGLSTGESTRGMDFVLQEADRQPADVWTARVIAVLHHAPRPLAVRGIAAPQETCMRGAEPDLDRQVSPDDTQAAGTGLAEAIEHLPAELALLPCRSSSEPGRDPVDCLVFAPPSVARGGSAKVTIFAHFAAPAPRFRQPVTAAPKGAPEGPSIKYLETDVPHDAKMLFHLVAPGLEVEKPIQALVWSGRTQSVQFQVTAPEKPRKRTVTENRTRQIVTGTLIVSLGESHVPIGHIKFKLGVTKRESQDVSFLSRPAAEATHRYERAFLSYATADRQEVEKRVQILMERKIAVFGDVLEVDPGDRWGRGLYRHIDECDLFLLFWSAAAAKSPWLLEEVRYALRRKAGDGRDRPEILAMLIEGSSHVDPLEDLKPLDFDSRLVYFVA